MSPRFTPICLALMATSGPLPPVHAANMVTLDPVLVTADKLITPTKQADETVYTGTAVTRLGIEQQGRDAALRVHDAIDILPGVNSESPDASGLAIEQSSVRLRGVRSSLGALTVEGVPNYGGNPIGPRDYLYDLENMAAISVYKGATPGDIGTGVGSRGGAIVLHPKWSGDEFAAQLSQAVGGDDYRRTFLRMESGKLGAAGTRIAGAASYSEADKWRGPGDLGPRVNANLNLLQPLGDNLELKFWLNHNDQKQHLYRPLTYAQASDLRTNNNLDYNSGLTGVAATDINYYGYNKGDYQNDDLLSIITWRPSASTTVTLKPYYADEDSLIHQGTTSGGGRVQTRTRDIERMGVIAEAATDLNGVKAVLGYHHETSDMNIFTQNYAITGGGLAYRGYGVFATTGTTYVKSPYAKLAGKTGKLSWQAGLKHFSFEDSASEGYTTGPGPAYALVRATDLDRRAETHKIWLPTLGMAYDLTPEIQLHASAGRNFIRPYSYLPLVNYYNTNRAAFQAGGVTLQNLFDGYGIEASNTLDLGLRHTGERFEFSPTLFFGKHKNLLTTISDPRVTVGGLPANYQQNIGKATGYGLELAFSAFLSEQLNLFINPTYTHLTYDGDITYQGTTIAAKGRQVVDTPVWMARAGLNYRWGSFEFTPSLRYLGARYGNTAHTERVGGYVLADLALRYTRKKALGGGTLKAGLELNNLFDKKYVAVINASDDNLGGGASYLPGAPFAAAACALVFGALLFARAAGRLPAALPQ